MLRIIGDIDNKFEGKKNTSINEKRILYLTNSDISFPYLTLKEDIELFENIYSFKIDESKKYTLYSDDQIDRLSVESSLGMKIKVGLSMLLKSDFWDLIILDEAISAIDQTTRKKVILELEERSKEGSIVIITTHDGVNIAVSYTHLTLPTNREV